MSSTQRPAPSQRAEPVEMTLAEIMAGLGVGALAVLILTAYGVDALGWPIDPAIILVLWAVEAVLIVTWLWRRRYGLRVSVNAGEVAGFVVIVVGLLAYIMWL